MKKNLLYSAIILLGLNGLHAFNPFTAMGNLVRGENGCQPSLVDQIAKGLPEYQASIGKTLKGPALKKRQDYEKDIEALHKCVGDNPDYDQQILLGKTLGAHHPKLTSKILSVCDQDRGFQSRFPNQCSIARKASGIKDTQAGSSNTGESSFNSSAPVDTSTVAPSAGPMPQYSQPPQQVMSAPMQPQQGYPQQPQYPPQYSQPQQMMPAPMQPQQGYPQQPPQYLGYSQPQYPPQYSQSPQVMMPDPMQQNPWSGYPQQPPQYQGYSPQLQSPYPPQMLDPYAQGFLDGSKQCQQQHPVYAY